MKQLNKTHDAVIAGMARRYMKTHPLVIGNNCVSSYLYKYAKTEFNSPFAWAAVRPGDFLFLIENFNEIDFSKAKFCLQWNESKPELYVKAVVDNRIELHYVHYLKKTAVKNRMDIVSDDIIDIARNKYERRVKRLQKCRLKPNFIFHVTSYGAYVKDKDAVDKIARMKKTHVILEKPDWNDNCYAGINLPNCFECCKRGKTLKPVVMQYLWKQYIS